MFFHRPAHVRADLYTRVTVMAAIVFVRVKSPLDARELENRVLERRPRFRKVPGLVQKVYGRDESSGDMCGIYSFESKEALDGFRDSALAQTMGGSP